MTMRAVVFGCFAILAIAGIAEAQDTSLEDQISALRATVDELNADRQRQLSDNDLLRRVIEEARNVPTDAGTNAELARLREENRRLREVVQLLEEKIEILESERGAGQ